MKKNSLSRRTLLQGAAVAGASVFMPAIARAEPPTIRYATSGGIGPNGIDTLFFTEYMRKNVLKRYGKDYTLSVVYTRGTPEAASLLAAGQADLASQACTSFAAAIARDAVAGGLTAIADVHDVKPGFSRLPFCVLENSEIKTVADLRGKTIAVNAYGAITDIICRTMLERNGLDPRKDVRIVEISFPSIGPALRDNRVACGALPVPFGPMEADKGGIREIFSGADAFGTFTSIFQVGRTDYLNTSGDVARAWLDDYVRGLHWMYQPENRAAAVALAAEVSKSTPAVLDTFFLTKKDYYRNVDGCIEAAMLQPPIDAMFKQGLIKKAVDVKPFVNTKYLPKPC